MRTAWLLRDGDVLASAEIADRYVDRARGLLGRDEYDGAMLFPRTRSVHSVFMRFPVDVALLDRELVVVALLRVRRWRVVAPRRRCRSVLEASAGTFDRWGLQVGDRLELRGPGDSG